jgi:hypothetical protein
MYWRCSKEAHNRVLRCSEEAHRRLGRNQVLDGTNLSFNLTSKSGTTTHRLSSSPYMYFQQVCGHTHSHLTHTHTHTHTNTHVRKKAIQGQSDTRLYHSTQLRYWCYCIWQAIVYDNMTTSPSLNLTILRGHHEGITESSCVLQVKAARVRRWAVFCRSRQQGDRQKSNDLSL